MSAIVLNTADPGIRHEVAQCARRTGVHVAVHETLTASFPAWRDADLVLLGGDQIRTAAGTELPKCARLDVVTVSAADDAPFDLAGEVGACYLVLLPLGGQWLTGQFDGLPDHPVKALREAGFQVGFADPVEVARVDGLSGWEVRQYSYSDAECPFVTLDEVARGECSHGQSDLVVRSNFRTLPNAYPDMFVEVRYRNVTALGAVVADLTAEAVDAVIGLREQYPLLDDSDHSELEHEDIIESWTRWVSRELFDRVHPHTQDVWIAIAEQRLEELFREVVDGLDYWPQHDGRDIDWDLDLLAGPFAARLMAEFRRTFRPHPAFTILTRARDVRRRPGPRYAVTANGFPFVLAQAWSRFSAKTQLWARQSAWLGDLHAAGVRP